MNGEVCVDQKGYENSFHGGIHKHLYMVLHLVVVKLYDQNFNDSSIQPITQNRMRNRPILSSIAKAMVWAQG